MGAQADEESKGPKGYEVGYELFSINGKTLGAGEPIRVKQGERVLFHVLNASATEIRNLALPGHAFRVVALDGNPVPTPAEVPVLWLGTAERISAIVEMDHPGVFVLGDVSDDDRSHGMGIVVEYSGRKGKPLWFKPKPFRWDYTRFGKSDASGPEPDEAIELLIVKHNAAANDFNLWTLNGEAFSMKTMTPLYKVQEGRPYRLFVAYLGFAFTRNVTLIAVLFAGYGLYQGIFRSVGKALATDFVPDRLRASGLGWYNTTLGLMSLVASVVAGLLWDHVGHAAVFIYGAIFAVIGSIAFLALLPAEQRTA
jgi:Multicopper oxidase/Major Facilitator Superfamily